MTSTPSRESRQVRLLDGGFATHLETLGANLGDDPLWSAKLLLSDDGMRLVEKVHLDYLMAGCDILTTASYQAHIPTSAISHPLPTQITNSKETLELLFVKAMKAAKTAKENYRRSTTDKPDRIIHIAGSMGSFGAVLANGAEYSGDFAGVTWDSLVEFHRLRIAAVIATEPDLLAFETIPSVFESSAIVRALDICAETLTIPPAWIAFSFRSAELSCGGNSIAACANSVKNKNVFAVGVNCTKPEFLEDILFGLKSNLPENIELICYPNKGETWDAKSREWVISSGLPSETTFADLGEKWMKAGATIIGGVQIIYVN
ncbi:Catalyzes methyl transfer from S-methylmethionine (SMM) to adenosyl-L-homocysteine (AdoMet) [Physocladia obscura]|uniref:Catalyzes methyl transfer from S-methylmethionine (SMM) to adenosyl-L-homocysteine (AdoMet) n=1 Tax=Physocladia obscura TaxID=109957 RepID=A0AAD5T6X8_9FUNG|nr:Catalyzes methyl transfer from S-methylmethionine (SMM) to adenosyl-L-homocysteine (AdoMet) [Physocladia obscura]